ncbi:hemolysin XhlA family protein [Pseudescherichia sp. L3]|uniref:hemolysin XhlA family protein n=1 Tax=Pseudescherichia sp. L3 TaxID=2970817 RepID=UPI00215015AA|nr:hemolysin XhlA family protein [Pseudescherichia sp. L3]MCR4457612.1 hemolysin XhlA family protein [Pseudescherichia sp. L3]
MAERKYLSLPNGSLDAANEMFHSDRHGGGSDGGDGMHARVAKLESDVTYIRRDIDELKVDVKSIDSRLSNIENGINSLKSTIKAAGTVVSVVFVFCAYVFGSYVAKIIDALNELVLK